MSFFGSAMRSTCALLKSVIPSYTYIFQTLDKTLDENKTIWKKMRNLGLLPQRKENDLHGFKPGKLNAHFAGIAVSSLESIEEAMDIILPSSEEAFTVKPTIGNYLLAQGVFPSF